MDNQILIEIIKNKYLPFSLTVVKMETKYSVLEMLKQILKVSITKCW